MDLIKNIVLYLWQLPQNLLGFLIVKLTKAECHFEHNFRFFVSEKFWNSGISLGNYIILDKCYTEILPFGLIKALRHETGHQKQSKYLGWFYLLIVGIPSIFRNIYDRIAHKKWSSFKRNKWYYTGFPENWADKLGGVNER
jgi:hypothetical protein